MESIPTPQITPRISLQHLDELYKETRNFPPRNIFSSRTPSLDPLRFLYAQRQPCLYVHPFPSPMDVGCIYCVLVLGPAGPSTNTQYMQPTSMGDGNGWTYKHGWRCAYKNRSGSNDGVREEKIFLGGKLRVSL